MFDPQTMRARYRELTEKADAIRAVSDPLRAERDAEIARHTAVVRPLEAQIKTAEAGLFDIEVERSTIVRALKGKVAD